MEKQLLILALTAILTFVGCGKNQGSEDQSLVIPDLSFDNFTVFHNKQGRNDLNELTVLSPPFDDQTPVPPTPGLPPPLTWVPDGRYGAKISNSCHFSELEKLVFDDHSEVRSQTEAIQKWVNKCESELSYYSGDRWKPLLQLVTVKYPLIENPHVTKVKINLSNGTVLRGVLGLKRDGKKRPMIVVQTGVHGNASDGPFTRNVFMQLFDESPFNVLYLGNVTGREFLLDNGFVTVGGLDEGRHIVEVSKMVQSEDSPFRDLISEVHVLGVSLGGHGALYSSLYNSFSEDRPIKSVLAFCPVNDLEPTVYSVFDESLRGWFYNYLTTEVIKEVYDRLPVIKDLLPKGHLWSKEQVRDAVITASYRHYREISQVKGWTYAPFDKTPINKVEDVWSMSKFFDYVQFVNTPTAVVYSKDDYFVLPEINSNVLIERLKKETNPNIGVIGFEKGNHCANSMAQGWATISSLFRTYFLSRTKDKSSVYSTTKVNLKDVVSTTRAPFTIKLDKTNVHTRLDFSLGLNKDLVRLDFVIFDPKRGRVCRTKTPLTNPSECYRRESLQVPVTAFADVGIKKVKSEFDQKSVTRWLNTHVEVLTSDGDNILSTNQWPVQLKINGRFDSY